uniref:Uncharacterized protein LOC111118186 n=1 Tax=Crassostrea virginica TaxID=6565 RepID=A0A8B8CBT9_CRAVI|nr:uncharacterized protein LOC111118186 [Crassostrea virginica]
MSGLPWWSGVLLILGSFLSHKTESSTLCVQCNSKYDQHCEENPPGASNCLERTSKRNGCLVTRISTNGKQSAFIRSCSTLDPSVPWEGCVNDTSTPGQLQTKCYILCFEDGCNNSYVTSGQIFPVFILSSLLFLAINGWF